MRVKDIHVKYYWMGLGVLLLILVLWSVING